MRYSAVVEPTYRLPLCGRDTRRERYYVVVLPPDVVRSCGRSAVLSVVLGTTRYHSATHKVLLSHFIVLNIYMFCFMATFELIANSVG